MKQKLYRCGHCGNIIAMIRDRGVPVYCCGEKMCAVTPGITDASGEKHIPIYSVDGSTVAVSVGSVEHPMTQEHYIEWVCLETEQGVQYKNLEPGGAPRVRFSLCDDDQVKAVFAFCNQHNLWKN